MEQVASYPSVEIADSSELRAIEQDARWQMTQQLLAHQHFSKSPLLSKFLLYIVSKTLQGRQHEITEHAIGVQVFGRSPSYRTVEDNIVRNYARQLRKRLAEHFNEEGSNHPMRLEIPLGGYVPAFVGNTCEAFPLTDLAASTPLVAVSHDSAQPVLYIPEEAKSQSRRLSRILTSGILLTIYSAVLISVTWLVASHVPVAPVARSAGSPLWKSIFDDAHYTYIVPPDAGLNLMEDLTHHPLPLADYIRNGYSQLPLPHFDAHSADDLRTHEFTGFANMQIVAELVRRPEYNPARAFLRFPRDLRLDDLKNANAILIGSSCSNPWAALADGSANFAIVCNAGMQTSTVLNRHPHDGEATSYASHWNEPTHETYAIVSFAPNLSGKGDLLLLEGLDVAGTQAASEALLHSDALHMVLKLAARPDGSSAPFEVLLRSTSIESNATDTHVIASRIY